MLRYNLNTTNTNSNNNIIIDRIMANITIIIIADKKISAWEINAFFLCNEYKGESFYVNLIVFSVLSLDKKFRFLDRKLLINIISHIFAPVVWE